MNFYMYENPSDFIRQGKIGIPSWSKALVIHDPYKYAIFDARVSASLNSLQIINCSKDKILFPILSSRNNTISEETRNIRDISKSNNWRKLNDLEFYSFYLELLLEVSNKVNTSISTVEMLLFAKAENLVKQVTTLPNIC